MHRISRYPSTETVGAVNALTADGLFIGQPAVLFELLGELAHRPQTMPNAANVDAPALEARLNKLRRWPHPCRRTFKCAAKYEPATSRAATA